MADREHSTKAVVRQRIEQLIPLRLDGSELHDLRDFAAKNGWNVSGKQLSRYIKRADEAVGRRLESRHEVLLGRAIAQRRRLVNRALKDGNLPVALAAMKDEAELCHLYQAAPAGSPSHANASAPEPTLADYRAALVALLGTTGPETPDVRPDHTAQ